MKKRLLALLLPLFLLVSCAQTAPATETPQGISTSAVIETPTATQALETTKTPSPALPSTPTPTEKAQSQTPTPRVGVAGVRFSCAGVTLTVGQSAILTATVLPENATERGVTFTNSDPEVCSYDGQTLIALTPGRAELCAVTSEDGYIARCVVTVLAPTTPTLTTPTPTQTPITQTPTPTPTPTPSPTPTPTPTPTPPSEKRVSFIAAGDNIIHEAVFTDAMTLAAAQTAENGYAESYYFDSMYGGVASLISGADIAFVNHECPVAGAEYGISGYPSFNSPIEAVKALERVGFDVVNVANNHMLDMEKTCTGYRNTVRNVKENTSMLLIGGYTKDDYDDLRILEVNGVRVAFLSYTTCLNDEEVNAASPEMRIPWAEEGTIRRQTAEARANADFVVVSVHWGDENSNDVNASQKTLARLFCECGVDVILGHHSHTVQPVEWIENAGKKTLCCYSLGNFLSTQHPINNLVGIFASFDLVVDENGAHIENACAIPHMTWYSFARDALQVYRLCDVTPALIETHGSQLRVDDNGGAFTLEDIYERVRAILKEYLKN